MFAGEEHLQRRKKLIDGYAGFPTCGTRAYKGEDDRTGFVQHLFVSPYFLKLML
jgi:hypothetical protein